MTRLTEWYKTFVEKYDKDDEYKQYSIKRLEDLKPYADEE